MEDKRPNSEGRARAIYRVTIGGSVCNFLLLLFKFVAGILGGSAAMLADAVHSLSDFVTDVVVILFVRISSKPCDADHDFGHGKYETLASVFIGLMLACVGIGILWSGAEKIIDVCRGQVLEQPGMIAFVAALLSIVVKEVLYQWTARVGRRVESTAVVANAWHHRSDALSSIGTALGIGGAILLGPNWRVLDPIAAVIVSVFIIRVAFKLFVPSIQELLENHYQPLMKNSSSTLYLKNLTCPILTICVHAALVLIVQLTCMCAWTVKRPFTLLTTLRVTSK